MARVHEGCVLGGRYRLTAKLGEGSMGAVWRAEHLALSSSVAVKVLDESIAKHPVALARFMREAQAAASLRSLHVVQIHDFGVDQGVPYISMELLDGEPLGARLDRAGKLSPADTAIVISHIARGIGKAHDANVIHRDLKPDNVFIVREDDEEYAKVVDFGVAKSGEGVFASTLTSAGKLLGTPGYMSAEQAAGEHVDYRTDIWSMTVIAFECLTGTLPFVGDNLPDLLFAIHDGPIPIPSRIGLVPIGFDAWFARGVARDRGARFQSAKEAAAELRALCGLEAPARTFGGRTWTGSFSGSLAPRSLPREEVAAAHTERVTPMDPARDSKSTAPPSRPRTPAPSDPERRVQVGHQQHSEPPPSFDDIIRAEDILATGQRPLPPRPGGRGVFAVESGRALDGEVDDEDFTGDRTGPRGRAQAAPDSGAAPESDPPKASDLAPSSDTPSDRSREEPVTTSVLNPPQSADPSQRAEVVSASMAPALRSKPIVVEVARPRAVMNTPYSFRTNRVSGRAVVVSAFLVIVLGWAYAVFSTPGAPEGPRRASDRVVPAAAVDEPMPRTSAVPASTAPRQGE